MSAMDTRLSLKEIPSYLRWKDSLLDLRYRFDSNTADYTLTRLFDPQLEEDLERFGILDVQAAKNHYSAEIENAQRTVYFYRIANIMFLVLFILIPSIAVYFILDGLAALVFGLLFSLLMFFLVECFNQAYLNKFQKQLKDDLEIEEKIQGTVIPFREEEIHVQGSSATVQKEGLAPITDPNFKKGNENIIRFRLEDGSLIPSIELRK
jgi:ABC-type multidrug transport system fused ATPase/permease subunit